MSTSDLNAMIKVNMIRLTSLNFRREAFLRQYDSACIDDNQEECEKYRSLLHANLEETLDVTSSNLHLTKLIIEGGNSTT